MVINCPECKYKCALLFNSNFHNLTHHEDKMGKCACGDKTLSGICIKEFAQEIRETAQRSCLVNHERSSLANSQIKEFAQQSCSFKDESGYNSSSNPCSSSSSNSSSNSNPSINSSSNPNPNLDSNTEVLSRICNKCNYVKPLFDFDE